MTGEGDDGYRSFVREMGDPMGIFKKQANKDALKRWLANSWINVDEEAYKEMKLCANDG